MKINKEKQLIRTILKHHYINDLSNMQMDKFFDEKQFPDYESFHIEIDYSDYDGGVSSVDIIGQRLETNEERDHRVTELVRRTKETKIQKKEQRKRKEEIERATFERLNKKYGKVSK